MGWTGRGKAGEHHVGKQLMGSACNGQNVPVLLLSGMFYQRAKVWEMPKCRNALASPSKALLALDGAESSQLCPNLEAGSRGCGARQCWFIWGAQRHLKTVWSAGPFLAAVGTAGTQMSPCPLQHQEGMGH